MHMGGGENPPDISESGLFCLGLPTCPTLSGLDEVPKGRVGEGSGVPKNISSVFLMHVQMGTSAQHSR